MAESHRLTVTIVPGIYELLRLTAEAEGRTAASLANFIIEAWLREHAHSAPLAEVLPQPSHTPLPPTSP